MAIAIPQNQSLIQVYFNGGSGYNIGKRFIEIIKANSILQETVSVCFLDTSTGNDHEYNTPENTMVLGTGKGSGKLRGENAEDIMEAMDAVLHTFKPGVFNIGVAGASGGSGSTIENCLQASMAERGIDLINFMIGSRASATEFKNTNKTFRSFANNVNVYQRPALVHYRENNAATTRAQVDEIIINNLVLTCLLLSGKDDKMDVADINNLLNYPVVTNFAPTIVSFDLFADSIVLEKHELLIAAATLASPGMDTTIEPTPPEYHTAGYLSEDVSTLFKDIKRMHWGILGNSFGPMMKALADKVKDYDEAAKAIKLETFSTGKPTDKKSALEI